MHARVLKVAVLFLIVLTLISVLIYKFAVATRELTQAAQNNLPSTNELSRQDSVLFNADILKRIYVRQIYNNKLLNPTLALAIDKKWPLVVTQIAVSPKFSFSHLAVGSDDESMTTNLNYLAIDNFPFFKIDIAMTKAKPIDSLSMKISGEVKRKELIGDSLLVVSGVVKGVSFSWADDRSTDLWFGMRDDVFPIGKKVALDIFIRKMDSLLVVYFLTADAYGKPIPDEIERLDLGVFSRNSIR